MANRLRVRIYNVRFGDAILVTVPDRDPTNGKLTRRNILIDVGNSLNKAGGADDVFKPVVENIVKELRGRPLDLYVMTHEHLDHVQGLHYAERKIYTNGWLKEHLNLDTAWFTASAANDYYDHHPEAKRKKQALVDAYDEIAAYLGTRPASEPFRTLLEINNPRSTKDCVDYLKTLAPEDRTHYVHRGLDVNDLHPFNEARFEIWAPEEDTSNYYHQLTHMDLEAGARAGAIATSRSVIVPPSGVDTGAFYDLVEARSHGFADNLLAIDKAGNNTSIVLLLQWRGWRLLFTADAELASWRRMNANGMLKPVHFLKVSHHGSHNGTPPADLLNKVLPLPANGKKKGRAIISTWDGMYSGIPHEPTNTKLRQRARLRSTLDQGNKDRLYMDACFTA
jgi:beta-lactamase superfamily II metal-dependent hydrolase